uniref:Uncharacterized protein n=1 Tax=Sphaerodactylus townsendi TaxID=933632 RepID=A0ACB8F0U7_9SAUR
MIDTVWCRGPAEKELPGEANPRAVKLAQIYRIEWATTNFVQPSVYKHSGGPSPPNAYLLDNQKYLKGPIQPVPYPPYQPVANNPQFVLPFFKAEGPAANLTEQIGVRGNPLQGSPFAEGPPLLCEDLAQRKDHPLQAAVPGPNLEGQPAQAETYDPAKEHPVDHSRDCKSASCDLVFQDVENFPVEGEDSKEKDTTPHFMENPALTAAHPESWSPVHMPSAKIMAELETCMNLEGITTNENDLLAKQESFGLPEKVLLEDTMKLFDCSPDNSGTEEDPEIGTLGGSRGDSDDNRCPPRKDSSSDIRSLNLPDELLSFDYSVPEIVSTVTSLDYFYDMNAFGEDPTWESKGCLQAPQKQDVEFEKRKDGTVKAKKGRSVANKPRLASALGE